jgi:integrase
MSETIGSSPIGTRRNELLHLERRQLDLEHGKITFDPSTTKNKESRIVYLLPEALEALKVWDEGTRALEREQGAIVRCVFHRHGRPVRHFPYELWHSACTNAGIVGASTLARRSPNCSSELPSDRGSRRHRDANLRMEDTVDVRSL